MNRIASLALAFAFVLSGGKVFEVIGGIRW
jgi:hypothetical protein